MSEYKVIKNYRNNDKLRASFNELAKKTFGINFEDWYQNGYWTDRYNPYSIVLDGKIVAEIEDGKLILDMVISEKEQNLNHIVECFGKEIQSVVLGFTPKDTEGFTVREMNQDDRTMHVKGNGWEEFEIGKLMVPLLAHA